MADVETPEVPPQEEQSTEVLSTDDTTGIASEVDMETEKEKEKEASSKEAANGAAKKVR
jgi:hypothetical protein